MEALTADLPAFTADQPLLDPFESPPDQPGDFTLRDRAHRLGRRATAVVAAFSTFGAGLAEAPEAFANGQQSAGTPNVTIITRSGSASVESVVDKRVIIGEDEHLSEKNVNQATCQTFRTFKNSMETPHGKVFFIDHNGRLCRDSQLSTGWIKVGGGMTGRNCGNEAAPMSTPVPNMAPKNARIINVENFNINVRVRAIAHAKAAANCEGSSAGSSATGEVTQKINLRRFLKISGPAEEHFALALHDRAVVKAKANANCSSTVIQQPGTPPGSPQPPTPTPSPSPQPPNVRVLQKVPAFEGPFENGTDQICADASSNPTTDGVTVTFSSRFGQTSPAFSDGVPNEFCTIYTAPNSVESNEDVTATATDNANGKQASDDTGPFPVMQDSF